MCFCVCVCVRVHLCESECVLQSVVRSDPIFITHWLKGGGEALACSSDKCITPINPVSTEVLNADTHTHKNTDTREVVGEEVVTERE